MKGRTLYIADLHLDHFNAFRNDGRNFQNCDEMNQGIIKSWNAEVCAEDTVWVLGDVCRSMNEKVYDTVRQLHGEKNLIIGNHDSVGRFSEYYELFDVIEHYVDYTDDGNHVVLFHYPIESWYGKRTGSIHIHGHTHGNTWDSVALPNRYNAWCVKQGYAPKSLEWYKETYGYEAFLYANMARGAKACDW